MTRQGHTWRCLETTAYWANRNNYPAPPGAGDDDDCRPPAGRYIGAYDWVSSINSSVEDTTYTQIWRARELLGFNSWAILVIRLQ